MLKPVSSLLLFTFTTTTVLVLNHIGLVYGQVGLFDKYHVYDVQVTLEDSDWALLRNEKWFESSEQVFEEITDPKKSLFCTERQNIYNWYIGNFTIDGVIFENVGVRRKGFVGSVVGSENWPSLKIDLQKYTNDDLFFNGTSKITCKDDVCDDGIIRSYEQTKRFTLNNNNQDITAITTCLNLDIFAVMGAIAPRCNFATVTVNGIARGTYTNIEPMKKDFLMRAFGDDTGDLYEGTLADLSEGNTVRLEKKTNAAVETNEHVDRMIEVLAIEDDETFLTEIKVIVDLPSFLLFAMVEGMANMDDGYTNNKNNFYAYFNILTKKWYFMPWSPDRGLMTDTTAIFGDKPADTATVVFTQTPLIRRLYSIPEIRKQYHEDMIQLLEVKWNTTAFLIEMDTMLNLTYSGVTHRIERIDEQKIEYSETDDAILNYDYDGRVNDMKLFFNTKKEMYLDELKEEEPRPYYNKKLSSYEAICGFFLILKYIWYLVAATVLLIFCFCGLTIWCCCKLHKKKIKPDEKSFELTSGGGELPTSGDVNPDTVLNATTGLVLVGEEETTADTDSKGVVTDKDKKETAIGATF